MSSLPHTTSGVNVSSTPDTVEALARLFGQEGYERGVPHGISGDDLDADIAACREATCPACGNKGLHFAAYRRKGSYRGIGSCPDCDYAMEC